MLKWNDPVDYIHGLTTQQRKVLKKLDFSLVGDLLSMLPYRYDDYSNLVKISDLQIGLPVTIKVKIKELKKIPTFRKRFVMIRGILYDETGEIKATWFNQAWMLKQLKIGDELYISGVIKKHKRFGVGFASPLWELVSEKNIAVNSVAPVYHLTGQVTQKTLRKIVKATVDDLSFLDDYLPLEIREKYELLSFDEAIRAIHSPQTIDHAERARKRLAFDEVFVYQLALRMAKKEVETSGAIRIHFNEELAKDFVRKIPFELTIDQKKVAWQIFQDLDKDVPMRRLLQGDVGAGKTIVSIFASLMVWHAGYSVALMAPTEILAKQHADVFHRFLFNYNVSLLLITATGKYFLEGKEKIKIKNSEINDYVKRKNIVVIGTHALLYKERYPQDLALVIVDEQHRFGVAQRQALTVIKRLDDKIPHLLSMTATPIPRSLALTFLGDLDVSIIRTKPTGRKPIITKVVVGDDGAQTVYQQIIQAVKRGEQAFVVCPLIDPSDVLGSKSVSEEAKKLKLGPLKGLKIGILHGKMTASEKELVMHDFQESKIDVLVSTTVIEVGIDIPRATIMYIESAERFGLAQLHQLRGRIGRADKQSYCYLMATDEFVNVSRLKIMERSSNGFEIAEFDLKIRGQGNVLGQQQSGKDIFKYTKLEQDLDLITSAREEAIKLLNNDAFLVKNSLIKEKVMSLIKTTHQE